MKRYLLMLMCLVAAPVAAQPYPSKPIEMISPTGAGGGSDLVARMVADIIAKEKLLSQPVIVVNKPGGGGAVGQTYTASKKGDPYTILVAGTTRHVPLRTGLDVGMDKFQPLGVIGLDLNSLAVREDSPFRTVKDLIAAAKAKPKTINVAITFPGGSAHGLIFRLEQLTGAKFNTVSFKSGTDAVAAVLGGHVHLTAENLGEVMAHVEGKKLRLLGVPATKRPAGLPNVPTLKEQGFDVQAGGYRSFVAPAGVSREVVTLWDGTLAKVHKSAAWKDYMARNMYEDVYMNADEMGRWLKKEQAEITRFLTEMGLVQKKDDKK